MNHNIEPPSWPQVLSNYFYSKLRFWYQKFKRNRGLPHNCLFKKKDVLSATEPKCVVCGAGLNSPLSR